MNALAPIASVIAERISPRRSPKLALITTSRMKTFRACQRLHYYEYILGYRAVAAREAAEFGTVFHAGLETWWTAHGIGAPAEALDRAVAAMVRSRQEHEDGIDETAWTKAELLMRAYDVRWSAEMEQYEVIGVEQEFATALINPKTGKACRGLRVGGKLDVLVRRRSNGLIWYPEHKTTSADLSPGSPYWERLRMDTQVSMYHDGASSFGYPVAGCIYDVISKPDIRPLKATPVEKRKYTKDGRLYANQREFDETPEEFKVRLAEKIAEAPEVYFGRAEILRLDLEIEAARQDTYETALAIRESIRTGRAPRNGDACHRFGSVCGFYDVCIGAASLDDETRFKKLESVHPELSEVTE